MLSEHIQIFVMGRKKDKVRMHFKALENESSNNFKEVYHLCLHCVAANEELEKTDKKAATAMIIKKLHGSVAALRRHLEDCPHTPEARMARKAALSLQTNNSPSVSVAQDKSTTPLSKPQVDLILKRLLEFQAQHRLPDSFIEDPTTKRLVESLDVRAVDHLPCRKKLGGSMLTAYADEVSSRESKEAMDIQNKSGGRANFLSDVWQNIAKLHLLGAQLILFGFVATLGLFATGSRHDGLELASQMEKIVIDAEAKGWNIGGVITDDAGQCGRARRILALRWPRIVILKCFAHDMNNLVKSVLRIRSFRLVTKQAEAVVNYLNASSAKWLPRAQEMMIQTYGKHWKFFTLAPTRWNSMQGCFASLLRVKTAMQMFAVKYRDDADFNSVMSVLSDDEFSISLKEAEQVVHPIFFASFKLQSDENTLADVVIVFRDLYDKFHRSVYRDTLLKLVEARWAACEQPLFMLALYLHPAYYKDAVCLASTKISGHQSICKIAEYYYRRLLGCEPDTLAGELDDWLGDAYMGNTPKEMRHFKTSSIPPLPAFWRHWKNNYPDHCLPKLALVVLSITANTATCERYFSELGLIHTALRNRMDPEKARKIAAIRKYLREKLSKKAVVESPAKRVVPSEEAAVESAFGTPERRSSSSCSNMPSEPTPSEEALSEPTAADSPQFDEQRFDVHDIVAHWESVLSAMEDGDDSDLQALFALADAVNRSETSQDDEEEDMPLPDRILFPDEDDKSFPQEKIVLRGLRGRKVSLAQLCANIRENATRIDFTML